MKEKEDIANEKCLYFNLGLYLYIIQSSNDREIVNKVIVQVYQTKMANYK